MMYELKNHRSLWKVNKWNHSIFVHEYVQLVKFNVIYITIPMKKNWNKSEQKRIGFGRIPYHPEISMNTLTQMMEIDSQKNAKMKEMVL